MKVAAVALLVMAMTAANVTGSTMGWLFCGDSRIMGAGREWLPEDTNTVDGIMQVPCNTDSHVDPVPAYEPLLDVVTGRGVGPGFAFAREVHKAIPLWSDCLLFPFGKGGATCSTWEPGQVCYDRMISKISRAKDDGVVFAGAIVCLGANDVASGLVSGVEAGIVRLVTAIRSETTRFLPVCLVTTPAAWLTSTGRNGTVNASIRSAAETLGRCYIIDADTVSHNADGLHENSAGARSIGVQAASAIKNHYGISDARKRGTVVSLF